MLSKQNPYCIYAKVRTSFWTCMCPYAKRPILDTFPQKEPNPSALTGPKEYLCSFSFAIFLGELVKPEMDFHSLYTLSLSSQFGFPNRSMQCTGSQKHEISWQKSEGKKTPFTIYIEILLGRYQFQFQQISAWALFSPQSPQGIPPTPPTKDICIQLLQQIWDEGTYSDSVGIGPRWSPWTCQGF